MSNIEIFTDGAYSSSRNVGGIGIVFIINGKLAYEFNKSISDTTNNKCELLAVIYALNSISKPIDSLTIYSDSQYVIGCITKGWQRKKNIELWELYDKVFLKASKYCSDIKFIWVKGHSDNDYNNKADKLAQNASQEI